MEAEISSIESIKRLSSQLLKDDLQETQAQEIVQALHLHLADYSGVSGSQAFPKYQQDIPLVHGQAISTNEAARCLLDTWRTVKFLRGLYSAVKDCQMKYPGQRIGVLYAGCGPYALFLSLLAPLFEPSEIGFTLLEVNEASFRAAQRLIERLGLGAYVDELLLQDAITYQLPKDKTIHVLFSETMDKALQKEALVPIIRNLRPQLPLGATIIPEAVIIGASLYPPVEKEDGSLLLPHELKGLLGLDLGAVFDLELILGSPNTTIKKSVAELPHYGYLVWSTEVVIWQNILLKKGESDITTDKIERLQNTKNATELILGFNSKGNVDFLISIQ